MEIPRADITAYSGVLINIEKMNEVFAKNGVQRQQEGEAQIQKTTERVKKAFDELAVRPKSPMARRPRSRSWGGDASINPFKLAAIKDRLSPKPALKG